MLHGVKQLTVVLKDTTESTLDAELKSSKALQYTLDHWEGDTSVTAANTDLLRQNCQQVISKHQG